LRKEVDTLLEGKPVVGRGNRVCFLFYTSNAYYEMWIVMPYDPEDGSHCFGVTYLHSDVTCYFEMFVTTCNTK
jgi:hypothetical protein